MTGVYLIVLAECLALSLASPSIPDALSSQHASKFLSLMNQVGFAATLSNGGPYTLLVPNDAAFNKVPAADMAALTSSQAAITDLLMYHVSIGETFSWDLRSREHLQSLNGHVIRVYSNNAKHYFNQALVVKEDIQAANVVIYIVDEVLDVPEGTIVDILGNPDYNTSMFLSLMTNAGLTRTFNSTSRSTRYTVFAPSNAALSHLPAAALARINGSQTYTRLLVEYHIHRGTVHASALNHAGSLDTIYTHHSIGIDVDQQNSTVLNHDAHLTITDIEAENGVVHVITHVLIPSTFSHIVG